MMSETAVQTNFGLRDEIKAYWSARAATFDTQPGHEIFSVEEREAWRRLFLKHLGEGNGRKALDLASGTGVISHLMNELGFSVTGIDWAEPMLERAREKAKTRGSNIRFLMGDAENTLEDDNSCDVITNRHLVWTLVDPKAAFVEWKRVLKPGGKLLIVDGDFVNSSFWSRLTARLGRWQAALFPSSQPVHGPVTPEMAETHRRILSQVYFAKGARAPEIVALLQEAGFTDIEIDTNLRAINKAQAKNMPLFKGLERATQHRYAICATKPL
jgi:ubiquinone/menaquinone biosynthesis C-methylase UbiE